MAVNQEALNVLNKAGNDLTRGVKDAIIKADRVASGALLRSVEYKTVVNKDNLTLQILANSYIINLEYGRGATKNRTGGFTVNNIAQWMLDKGIIPKNGTLEQAAYAIYKKINEEGYEGTPGLFTDVLTDSIVNQITRDILNIFSKNLLDNFANIIQD